MADPKRGWFARLTEGLTKSSKQMGEQIAQVFVAKEPLTQAKLDELEEMLIEADLGPHSAARIAERFAAEKFGKDVDEREIRVQTRYDEATSLVAIEITDRGVGIPAFLHARIFEPFFTTKRVGTGLGLSISRDIVTGMGGRIDVTSNPEEGTTFTVWLPAMRPDARSVAG